MSFNIDYPYLVIRLIGVLEARTQLYSYSWKCQLDENHTSGPRNRYVRLMLTRCPPGGSFFAIIGVIMNTFIYAGCKKTFFPSNPQHTCTAFSDHLASVDVILCVLLHVILLSQYDRERKERAGLINMSHL